VRFLVSLSGQALNKGWLFVFPAFQFTAQQDIPPEEFSLEEASGRSIPVNPVTVKIKVNSLFGSQEIEQTAFDLKWWYKKHSLQRRDSLLLRSWIGEKVASNKRLNLPVSTNAMQPKKGYKSGFV
jgi:hypothetical protein